VRPSLAARRRDRRRGRRRRPARRSRGGASDLRRLLRRLGRASGPGPAGSGPAMSSVAGAPPIAPGVGGAPPAEKHRMSTKRKLIWSVFGVWFGGIVLFVVLFGVTAHKAPDVASSAFSPVDEFKLDTWFKAGPVAFNKGVLYLLLTVGITLGVM